MRYPTLTALVLLSMMIIAGGVFLGSHTSSPQVETFAAVEQDHKAGILEKPDRQQEPAPSPDSPRAAGGADSSQYYGLSAEELERKRRRERRANAAAKRFDRAVSRDGLEADDVHPGVRSLMRSMKLEPTFDLEQGETGLVDGMRIRHIRPDSPLARAGFEAGDRLVRINGQSLRDPAQIAGLFARIEGTMEVCAQRSDSEHCRNIRLEAP